MPSFNSSTIGSYAGKWIGVTAVIELVVGGALVAAGLMFPEARSGLLITGGILASVGFGLLTLGRRFKGRAAEAQRVLTTGLPGTATVTGLTQTGMFLNENPQVEMQLMVQLPGRPPYAATRKEFIPLILLGRLNAGAPLPVKVDPKNPQNVVIDWEAPPPDPSASQGWWGTPAGVAATPVAPAGDDETLQEVQTALAASGLQAEKAFSLPEQGGYTVDQLRAYLRANGLSGTATIERIEDSGKDVGDDHLFTMEATLNVPGRPPHRGQPSAALVPREKISRLYVGATLPVKVAPDNPDAVMFEWDKI